MRILLFGNSGKVGLELEHFFSPLGTVIAPSHSAVNFLDLENLASFILTIRPDIIINSVAYNDVDTAEDDSELAYRINTEAPTLIARLAKLSNATLIHYSTNYVFDGRNIFPYTEIDVPHPINTYGRTKLAGEQGIQEVNGLYFIFRTSWIYSFRRSSFPTEILKLSRSQARLQVVTDQIASPTWAYSISELTCKMITLNQSKSREWWEERKGIYNAAGDGYCNRYHWAKTILENDPRRQEQIADLVPALTKDFPSPAQRPLNSALSCEKISKVFGLRLQPWETTLKEAMAEYSIYFSKH